MFRLPVPNGSLIAISLLATMTLAGSAAGQAGSSSAPSQPLTRAMLSTQLDSTFKTLDTNGDKALNTAEIEVAQKKQVAQVQANLGKRLDAEFARLDANKDGQLSLTEFKAAAPQPKVTPAAEMLAQIDSNKDGKITADEYRAVPLANFDRIDTNKDGTISAEEQSAAERSR